MILTISILVFVAWVTLGYFLFKRPPAEFVSRRKRILLYASTIVTAVIFIHDYLYDKNDVPLTYWQVFCEFMLSGTIYVLLIFGMGVGFNALVRLLSR